MKRFVLIHYSEIGLKGANKQYFVKKLRRQIKEKLEGRFRKGFSVLYVLGRLMVPLPARFNEEKYSEVLGRIFGIKNFQFVYEGNLDLEKLGSEIWDKLPKFSKDARPETFCVRLKRSQKLPYSSAEAERELGAILLENGLGMKVRLKGADLEVNVEAFNEHGYFSFKKYAGEGGMSANSGSKLIATISSGFDSPVAAYKMMRRGARIIFVHFHAVPYTDDSEVEQVKEIVKILSDFQFDTKLYLVPFGRIQELIATERKISAKIRVVLYRRMMLKIAERIAKKEKAKGIVTGDNFGQVASQTPENMFAIHEASSIPIFQPLIANDKEETIELARRIGTYEVSAKPATDPCSMYMPKKPELKANVYDVRRYEEFMDTEVWIEKAMKGAEVLYY